MPRNLSENEIRALQVEYDASELEIKEEADLEFKPSHFFTKNQKTPYFSEMDRTSGWGTLNRPTSRMSGLLIYAMGVHGKSIDDVAKMSIPEKKALGNEFAEYLGNHPVYGVAGMEEGEANIKRSGEIFSKAADMIGKEKLPKFNVKNPHNSSAEVKTRMATMKSLLMDFGQISEHMSSKGAFIAGHGDFDTFKTKRNKMFGGAFHSEFLKSLMDDNNLSNEGELLTAASKKAVYDLHKDVMEYSSGRSVDDTIKMYERKNLSPFTVGAEQPAAAVAISRLGSANYSGVLNGRLKLDDNSIRDIKETGARGAQAAIMGDNAVYAERETAFNKYLQENDHKVKPVAPRKPGRLTAFLHKYGGFYADTMREYDIASKQYEADLKEYNAAQMKGQLKANTPFAGKRTPIGSAVAGPMNKQDVFESENAGKDIRAARKASRDMRIAARKAMQEKKDAKKSVSSSVNKKSLNQLVGKSSAANPASKKTAFIDNPVVEKKPRAAKLG